MPTPIGCNHEIGNVLIFHEDRYSSRKNFKTPRRNEHGDKGAKGKMACVWSCGIIQFKNRHDFSSWVSSLESTSGNWSTSFPSFVAVVMVVMVTTVSSYEIIKCKWIKIAFRRKAGILLFETRWLPQLCLGVWDPWSIERWMRKRTTRDWKVVGRVVSSYVVTRYWCGTWTLCWQTIIFKNVLENWKVIRLINRGKRRMAF